MNGVAALISPRSGDGGWTPRSCSTPPCDAIARVERKYAVPEDVAERVLHLARAFLAPERFARDGVQRVTSLYLDTPARTFLRWHLERRIRRFKLRIRSYGARPRKTVYAEIKHKRAGLGWKHRVAVPRDALPIILGERLPEVDWALERDVVERLAPFASRRLTCGAEAAVLVSSLRTAVRGGTAGTEVAVTVDRDIVCAPPVASFDLDTAGWRPVAPPRRVDPSAVVLELKYQGRPPSWMAALIQRLGPRQVRFSKYVAAVQQLAPWEIRSCSRY